MSTPLKTFRDGTLSVSVWENSGKEDSVFYTTTIKKSYIDKKSKEWKETTTLSDSDLLKLALMLQLAYAYIRDLLPHGDGGYQGT